MPDLNELLIATHNRGKVRELTDLLVASPFRIRSLSEFPHIEEVDETGTTFAENAALKARAYAAQTGLWTLADDSGLEVEALGGAPGVYSARYAGAHATDAQRIARLLEELALTGDTARRARFACVIAIARPPSDALDLFPGDCPGQIIHAPRGTGGFGYDPVFVPEGHRQTFGELPHEVKQTLSHRARALRPALDFLHGLLKSSN